MHAGFTMKSAIRVSSDLSIFIFRYLPSQNAVEVLTNDRVDTYNIYGDYIYYQKNSQTEPALMRMYIDGFPSHTTEMESFAAFKA